MNSLVDYLVVACGEIVDTSENAPISLNNVINYWLITVVLLSISCLLLFIAIFVKYCMKRRLTIPCLLLY